MQKNLTHNEKGFTLIEMVVVVAIFAIAITIATDVFILGQRAQRKTAALQRLNTNLRDVTNKLANDLRTGSVDYDQYGPTGPDAAGVSRLAFKDFEGKNIVYKQSEITADADCPALANSQAACPTADKQCLIISVDGECASATSADINVDNFNAIITPALKSDSAQTWIRLNLNASATVRGQTEPSTLTLQTSVTSRSYKK